MQTIDLEMARAKTRAIAGLLDGLAHIPSTAPGLQAYHAAKGALNGNMCVSVDRRCIAIKKALKQFNVVVSISRNARDILTVRIFSPIKQVEIFM